MKKKYVVIIIISVILVVSSLLVFIIYNKKNQKSLIVEPIIITTFKDLKFEIDSKVIVKDILKEEYNDIINTNELGNNVSYVKNKNNDKIVYEFKYDVVDSTPPLIKGSSTVTANKGKEIDLVNNFLCGDYLDPTPKRYIEGDYNFNKVGSYNLTYVAEDASGNKSTKDFTLKVVNPTNSSSSSSSTKRDISEFINKYKNDNTKIGIDVSAWQGNINWNKVKENGVEFAMLRIGYGHDSNNEIVFDKQFKNNIKNAKEAGVPIGIYFYSYAKTKEESVAQAKWIIEALEGEKLDLPIAYDWENWSKFNTYNVSFKGLSEMADAFINEVEKSGYKGMLYSSAYYLNHIWKDFDNTWLAYYTNNNDYEKEYSMWQLSSSGGVNGISGYVDIDILFNEVQNKNP